MDIAHLLEVVINQIVFLSCGADGVGTCVASDNVVTCQVVANEEEDVIANTMFSLSLPSTIDGVIPALPLMVSHRHHQVMLSLPSPAAGVICHHSE